MSYLLILLLAGLSCNGEDKPSGSDTDALTGEGTDSDTLTDEADSGETDTTDTEATDTAGDCTQEEAVFVDWMAFGPQAPGRTLVDTVTDLNGREMPFQVQVTYPAAETGSDTPLADGGPWPVVLFEHAYGADYLNSDWLLDRLASRGFIVFSAGHNGAWDGAGDWWNDHAALFVDTANLAADWNSDPKSPFFGSMDLETTALMGHSHGGGAALQVMHSLGDVVDVDAVVLITVRPSLDGAYYSYHEVYDGMPPMLNIAASRDEDGTTAYGTSIGVYEAITRPRFMVTVEGASHYTFTDDASIYYSSIDRYAGQIAGGSGVVAFLEYLLHEDRRGLHSLRGDVPLFDTGGAPSRLQSHPVGELVIDDFEATISEEGTAIAGIDGQTFVNGFLGDTFAVYEEGVSLLMAEVEALSGDGDAVLFYQDASRYTDAYAEALSRLDRDVTTLTNDDAFEAALQAGGDWAVVVATQQDGNVNDVRPFDDELAAWICGGGAAILSDFRYASTSAAETFACAGVGFDGTTNWTTMTSQSALFDGDLRVQNTSWGVFSYGLWTTEQVFATNNITSEGVPDPTVSRLGSVSAVDVDTFEEVYAWDNTRALYMPTNALEIAWTQPGVIRWSLDTLDVSDWEVLALRVLQLHEDPLNKGPITVSLVIEDADGVSASQTITVEGTMDWLESTTPKSVFETMRLTLADFEGVDVSRLVAVSLVLDGSTTGRLLVDDLEFSPGLECLP